MTPYAQLEIKCENVHNCEVASSLEFLKQNNFERQIGYPFILNDATKPRNL